MTRMESDSSVSSVIAFPSRGRLDGIEVLPPSNGRGDVFRDTIRTAILDALHDATRDGENVQANCALLAGIVAGQVGTIIASSARDAGEAEEIVQRSAVRMAKAAQAGLRRRGVVT